MAQRAEHALFPGSFDPVTLGHVDLVERALTLFGRVTVLVAHNPAKPGLFPVEERARLLEKSLAHLARVDVKISAGLVVDAAREFGCDALVRGVRSGTDFDFEVAMARTNRALAPALDTVLAGAQPGVRARFELTRARDRARGRRCVGVRAEARRRRVPGAPRARRA
jgi:pantetheine-phosphate adenylyltransferase